MCRMYHYHSHEREIDSMLPNNYLQLPAELSGSMAKNRFRFEMLWGIYHIFEIYDKTDDFVAIFDFVCDVEIYSDLGDEYYQIKTKKETQPYTPKTLSNSKVAKDGSLIHSILGKLCDTYNQDSIQKACRLYRSTQRRICPWDSSGLT